MIKYYPYKSDKPNKEYYIIKILIFQISICLRFWDVLEYIDTSEILSPTWSSGSGKRWATKFWHKPRVSGSILSPKSTV